ncbi:MAG TPA: hypothetical protein VL651_07980 [Bacteroidia bacterium]|jgi:hypothetical protein|nr:hypothetical protein [Bacteroidia bacterium]
MKKLVMIFATATLLFSGCIIVTPHDNGKHKGWFKNPHNPHNPAHATTQTGGGNSGNGNNGHGKGKGK